MRKIIAGVTVIIMSAVASIGIASAAGSPTVKAVLAPFRWVANGMSFTGDAAFHNGKEYVPGSINYEGTTYIPIRRAAEALGFAVEWDAATATATLSDSDNEEDPISDVPGKYPSAAYTLQTAIRQDANVFSLMKEEGSPVARLKRGQSAVVLGEAGDGWLKIIANASIGYVRLDATDFVPSLKRPAWEQRADSIIEAGLAYLGTPYEFDADLGQTQTFDCSSYVNYLYEMLGMDFPRNSRQQSKLGETVAYENVRKGDLLFFTTPKRSSKSGTSRIGHVAIALGDDKVLHTYRSGIGVTVTLLDGHWKGRLITAKRVLK
jgi:hypothetical protein